MSEILDAIAPAIAERYEILRELGRGGVATVYLARDRRHDRKVAFKVLRSSMSQEDAVKRFLSEVCITASLQHPHILTLLDSGEANGYCYYVTTYMDRESLRQLLILEKQLAVDVALNITRQVASALEFAHNKGVIHRDIKPENILLTGTHAVVGDFGLAQAFQRSGTPRASQYGAIGTMAYMSPEQVMSSPDLDGRCDLYALGCTLFEMLAGRTPFVGLSPQELANQQLNATPPVITSLRPLVPPELVTILDRLLAKNPADRFATATDLLTALSSLGVNATPTPPSGYRLTAVNAPNYVAPRAERPLRKRVASWVPALGVAAIAVASLAAIGVWRGWPGEKAAPSTLATAAASVAVLPFDPISGGEDAQYFAEGLTEEIIAQLASVPGLKVISRTSVSALKRSSLTLPQIADTLGVRHVLEGSVRREGTKVRITAQLIEAHTDAHLWSQTYERDASDMFGVQDEIARGVSTVLSTAVQGLGSLAESPHPVDTRAYDAYLQGKFLLRQLTPEALRASVATLRRAIELDPNYAPGYAALAHAYSNMTALYHPRAVDPYTVFVLMRLLGDKALELDPGLSDAYVRRADAILLAFGSADSAIADYAHALELRPNAANLHTNYADGMAFERKYSEALAHAAKAVELDPLSPGARLSYAAVAAAANRWDVVLTQARHARALAGPLTLPTAWEATALFKTNRAEECVKLALGPWRAFHATCLRALHRSAEEKALIDSLLQETERDGVTWLNAWGFTMYYATTGNAEEWARWFMLGVERSPEVYFTQIINSNLYDPIRNSPLFEPTLQRARETIRQRFAAEYARLTIKDALQ